MTAWRPAYQHEVAVVARLRHVSCPDGCEETPAVVLRIDNADNPGEIAMTADDVSAMIEGLVALRRSLLAPGERPVDDAPPLSRPAGGQPGAVPR